MTSWDTSSGTGGILRVSATEIGVDIANNRSTVSAGHEIFVPAATFWNEAKAASLSGDYSWSGSVAAPSTGSARWITAHSGSTTKDHNPDGTGSFTITGNIAATGTTGFGGPTTNGPRTLTLTSIPRGALDRWNGAAWPMQLLERWDGSQWKLQLLERWNGAAWVRQI